MNDMSKAAALMGSRKSERKTAASRQNGRKGGRPRKHTQAQDHIIDHVGADNWQSVVSEFGGKSVSEILAILNEMFPTEDNESLAESIRDETN